MQGKVIFLKLGSGSEVPGGASALPAGAELRGCGAAAGPTEPRESGEGGQISAPPVGPGHGTCFFPLYFAFSPGFGVGFGEGGGVVLPRVFRPANFGEAPPGLGKRLLGFLVFFNYLAWGFFSC